VTGQSLCIFTALIAHLFVLSMLSPAKNVSDRLSRRDREIQYKRLEILEAAQEVFAEKGYQQATLEEIANRAEFGKGTLYNYYPSGKQEILLAIFERLYGQLCELIGSTFNESPEKPFTEQLHSFFDHTFSFFLQKLDLFVILIREAHRIGVGEDPSPQAFFIQQRNRAIEALSVPIQRAIDNGEISTTSASFLAHIIMVNVNGCQMKACNLFSEQDTDSPKSAAEMADFLTQLICNGVAKKPDTVSESLRRSL
jgi:TetR/AcrR family transcriptional regulator, repressor of fatR-cypB operon